MHKSLTRRQLLGGVSAVALLGHAPDARALLFGRGVSGGGSVGGGGGDALKLDTKTFVNTSGSTQDSGFVSPIFGQWFVDGDIPADTAPQFLVSGTPQPYSWGCQAYYDSGCLCFAAFMVRCGSSIAGSDTLDVEVWSGGTAPSDSSRTLAEVYAEDIQVNGTGLGSGTGLSGTWSAYIRSDTNNHAQSVYLDGQAGKVWRIETEWAQSAGGTAHGQLYCYHYIAALQDDSGDLGGFRYLARVTQPWYNYDVRAKEPRLFTALNWQHGAGPTTVDFPAIGTSKVFTTASNDTATTTSSNDWYNGGTGSGNLVPGYVTVTGGAMDTGLSANTLYWAYVDGSSSTNFSFVATSTVAASNVNLNGDATGTMTFNVAPTCLHFGSVFNATASAEWNFFQGAGSFTTDNTVRTTYDPTYLLSTGLLPPIDLAQPTPNDLNAAWAASYNWNPCSWAMVNAGIGHPGLDPNIGLIMGYHTSHVFNQTQGGDKTLKTIALAGAFSGYGFRDVTTRNLVNFGSNTYTGMPEPDSNQQNTVFWNGVPSQVFGFTAPPSNNHNFGWSENDMSHMPAWNYYAYLLWGNPQDLDMMFEWANAGALGSLHRTPTVPTAATNIITAFGAGLSVRGMAWGNRNLQQAAALAPLRYPDGSRVSDYVVDAANANADWPVTMMTAALTNDWYANQAQTWGAFETADTIDFESGGTGFMMQYYTIVMCYAASNRRQRSAASSWLTKRAIALNHYASVFGQWHFYYENDNTVNDAASCANFLPGITDDTFWGIGTANVTTTIAWSSSGSPHFTITTAGNGYIPAAGDTFVFDPCLGGTNVPGAFSTNTPYFVRDLGSPSGSDYPCNLSAAPASQPDWASAHLYAYRAFVQPLTANAGSFVYVAIIAGSSSGSHPAWPQSAGSTVTDGGVTWKCVGVSTAIAPSDTDSISTSHAGGAGPWVVSANPPNAASGETANGDVGPDSYLAYHTAASAYMQHLGYSVSSIYTDCRTRLNVNATDFTGDPQWNWVP